MENDSIRKFYDGAEVFITGGSGFIGKVLIEKLLRSCPRVKTVYVLVRGKRNKTPQERVIEMTEVLLFDKLRDENPEALEKLQAIEGDAMQLKLGMSDSDLEKLKSCSVIFHAAASVRFDDPLKSAILLNTRGTREICDLARSMPNLKALVHVSTAYIQPKNYYVSEKIYPTDGNWKDYIKLAENLDGDLLDYMTQKLTHFAPNTYTFTKHMAEEICVDYKNDFNLPIVIYRPSIVTVSEADPVSGWCDNFNGPQGLLMVAGLGISYVAMVNGQHTLNTIPVDVCAKGMIIAAYKMWKDCQAVSKPDIPVYNAASIKLVTYDSLGWDIKKYIEESPSIHLFGIPDITFTRCVFYSWMIRIFRSLIPAMIVDGLLMISGNKPRLMKVMRIIFNADKALEHFSSHNFKFVNLNFVDLNLMVPSFEKDEFGLNERCSNSELYHRGFAMSIKVLFGETERDAEIARKRYPYIKFFIKSIHLAVGLTVLKLLQCLVKRCF